MINDLEKYLRRKVYNKEFEGCTYYLICNKEEYLDSVGTCNIDDRYTLFNFTYTLVINTLVSMLIRDNQLYLHDKVNKYIKGYDDDLLIIHLLTHSSGINSDFKPGNDVCIDHINSKLLKDIIEKLYKNSIGDLASKLIFEPLDMYSTYLKGNDIYTNITDLSNFIKTILNNGYYNGNFILDIKYIDMWFTPLFIGSDNIRTTIGWLNGSSTYLCNDLDCSINTIVYYDNSFILIDRDNELAIVFLFDKEVKNSVKNNINKYIYKLLKKYSKIY